MRGFFVVAMCVLSVAGTPAAATEPVVAVWYRGTPAGTPRLDDLAAIKAAGFDAVTWPSGDAVRVGDIGRLAEKVGLVLVIQPEGPASQLEGRVTIDTTGLDAIEIPARAWRAVANGARTISFDPGAGQGAGLERPDGQRREWVRFAVALARQLSANAELIAGLQRATPAIYLSPKPVSLDVQLFEGPRAWVIIATNTSRTEAAAEVALPKGVPYAIWVSLLDPSTIAMADRPDGARWKLRLDGGAAGVYVIDKTLK